MRARVSGYALLARNTAANLGGRLASIALALLVSTVLFRRLGAVDYGIWSLLVAVAGYSMLFDFGLGAAVERRVAAQAVDADTRGISTTLSTALTSVLSLLAIVQMGVTAWLLWRNDGRWPAEPLEQGLLLLPAGMAMTASGLVVGSGLSGIQRMAVLHVWRVLGLTLGSVLALIVVFTGVERMDALLLAYCSGGAATALLQWRALRVLTPGLRFRPRIDRIAAIELFRFGGVLQIATMVPPLAEYGFRVLLGARFGLEFSGIYDLAARAAIVLRSLAGALFTAMVPFGVQVFAKQGSEGLTQLVRVAVKQTALFVLPASALLWSQSDALVSLWLGEGVAAEHVGVGFRILLVAHALGALSVPMAMLGRAMGRPAFEAVVTAASFLAALVASYLAAGWPVAFGLLWGVPAAGGFVLWRQLGRALDVRFRSGRDLALIGLLTAVSFAGAEVGGYLSGARGLSSSLVAIGASGAAWFVALAVAAFLLGIVDPADWRALRRGTGPATG